MFGSQSWRRVDTRTVEILRKCEGGERTWVIRCAAGMKIKRCFLLLVIMRSRATIASPAFLFAGSSAVAQRACDFETLVVRPHPRGPPRPNALIGVALGSSLVNLRSIAQNRGQTYSSPSLRVAAASGEQCKTCK